MAPSYQKTIKRCCVWGCTDMTSKRHRFPRRDPAVWRKWVEVLKDHPKVKSASEAEILCNLAVCDSHFAEEDKCPELRRGLKGNAIPTLFISYSPPVKSSGSRKKNPFRRREKKTSCIPKLKAKDESTNVEPSLCTSIESRSLNGNEHCNGSVNPFHQIENNTALFKSSEQENPTNIEPSFCKSVDLEADHYSSQLHESTKYFDVDTYLDFDVAEKTVIINSGCGENHDSLVDCMEEEENQCDEPSVLDTIKNGLCRICGINEQSLIPVFEDCGIVDCLKVPLVKMIETYLPLQIEKDDDLPLNICYKCNDILSQWHELYVTCLAADRTFKNTFHRDRVKVENDFEIFSNRVEDDPNVFNGEHNYVKISESDPYLEPVSEPVSEPDPEPDPEPVPEPISHGNKENISCETCGFYVTGCKVSENIQSEILDFLERLPVRVRLYSCKYCADPFKNRYELKDHYVTCEQNCTICEICGTFVPNRKHLENHQIRTHDDKRIICDQCGELCKPHGFKNHLASKHSEPDYQYCELCCKILQSKSIYRAHMQYHFKGKMDSINNIESVCHDGKKVFICPVCSKMFDDKISLIIHVNKSGPMKCSTCNLKLKNERHVLLHKCKTWSCQYCDKIFHNRMKWKDHELIHTGERPYKCNFCDAYFRSIHQRTLHHRTHRLPLLECKYCSKKFKHTSALRKHMDFHEGIQFVCPICNKSLRRRTSLHAHIRRHKKDHCV